MKTNRQIILLGLCVAVLLALNFLSVDTTMRFNRQRDMRETVVKTRLVKIRAAEEAYCQRHGVYTDRFADLVSSGLLADSLTYIPYSGGRRFALSVTTQISPFGKTVPLMECSATYDDYLSGLDADATGQLNEDANRAGRFPGLKFGDLDTPNGNAGNWR